MRLIAQPIAGGFELCARLGIVLVAANDALGGSVIHAVFDGSPCAQAGIEPRDIILDVDRVPWPSVRRLTFSDRRASDVRLGIFAARHFMKMAIPVRVTPEHYRPLEDIAAEAVAVISARPSPDRTPYKNPRFEDPSERREHLLRWITCR